MIDRLEAERLQDVAIGRIARRGDGDALAGIERLRKASTKPADEPVVTMIRSGATPTP